MNRRKNNHVSPIYAMMLLWLGWTLILPLFDLFLHILPLTIMSVFVYNFVNAMRNRNDKLRQEAQKSEEKKEPAKPAEEKSSGNPQVDALIKQRNDAVSEMRRLNMNIENEKITAQINDMEYTTSQIFDYVIKHPDKTSRISKFLNYYLPTTIKLLDTYDKMNTRGIQGDNITSTMEKVDKTLDMVVDAFHRQLDTLFAGDALDVSSDIRVMENLMKTEGLADTDFNSEIKLTVSE